MSNTPKTLKEAEELAAQRGYILSDEEMEHIARAQASARKRLIATTPKAKKDWAASFNAYYPRLLKFIVSLGETLLTFAQTLIVSLGVPVVLVLLLIVEHQRVVHGIQLFEADHSLASFAALALVLLNLVLEFQIHHVEHVAGYRDELGKRWSLILWVQTLRYVTGYGYDANKGNPWIAQSLSPATRYKGLLRLVTFSILTLALVGSMKGAMDKYKATAWNEGIASILIKSNLTDLMTWIGGLLFAAAAVLAAQGLSRYVAIRCVEILAAMSTARIETTDPFAEEVDRAGAIALATIISAKDKAAKAAKTAAPRKTAAAPVQQSGDTEEVIPVDPARPFGPTAQGWELADQPLNDAPSDGLPFIPTSALDGKSTSSANGNGSGTH